MNQCRYHLITDNNKPHIGELIIVLLDLKDE